MYMIVGPNGAGKSTLYETVISDKIKAPFINADLIQKNEMKDQSMQGAYEAAKIAEQRRQDHLTNRKSFVSESTFSHPSKLTLIDEAKKAGFKVALFHVNVRSPNLSVARVLERVKEGGHDVPEDKIRTRYDRNKDLIRQAVLRSDKAFIYDNSALNRPPTKSIGLSNGKVDYLAEIVPAWARELYKKELTPYSQSRQNPAAASYYEIKKIASDISTTEPAVLLPLDKNKNYKGKIVGESALHILQKGEKENDYTAHFKSSLDKAVEVGENVSIVYITKHRAKVKSGITEKKIENIVSQFDKHLREKGLDDVSRQTIIEKVGDKLSNDSIQSKTAEPEKHNNPKGIER